MYLKSILLNYTTAYFFYRNVTLVFFDIYHNSIPNTKQFDDVLNNKCIILNNQTIVKTLHIKLLSFLNVIHQLFKNNLVVDHHKYNDATEKALTY